MPTINIHKAKAHLSRLVERAARGETIVIARAGRPKAMLVPLALAETAKPRRIGFLRGVFKVPEDFDRMGSEKIASLFGDPA